MTYKKRDFTQNRSSGYQWVLIEMSTSNDVITEHSDSNGGTSSINDAEKKELLHAKHAELYAEYWRLIRNDLTTRQKEVIELCAQGKTQIEIAKILGVNQSSVTKSLNGNVDYGKNADGSGSKRIYGGARKKLKRLALKDESIKRILNEIAELEGE